MHSDLKTKRAAFRALHQEGCLVLPNPWDIGGIRGIEARGFRAIATTGAGYATSCGKADQTLTLDEMLEHLRRMSAATDLPVNADFEGGFAETPADVAVNVRMAVETGVAGLSIEDRRGDSLHPLAIAVERIRSARAAIDEIDRNVILVGRSEGFLLGDSDVGRTIERLLAYAEAGADVLYAPGVSRPSDITAIVHAVAPKPVNVLLVGPEMTVGELAKLGVRRVSVGGFLASASSAGFDAALARLGEHGSLPPASFGLRE